MGPMSPQPRLVSDVNQIESCFVFSKIFVTSGVISATVARLLRDINVFDKAEFCG